MHDFGKSWRSGLAFLAVVKSINPALVDLRESLVRESRENIQLALDTAHHSLDIPPLLEPDGKHRLSTQCLISILYKANMFLHLHLIPKTSPPAEGLSLRGTGGWNI